MPSGIARPKGVSLNLHMKPPQPFLSDPAMVQRHAEPPVTAGEFRLCLTCCNRSQGGASGVPEKIKRFYCTSVGFRVVPSGHTERAAMIAATATLKLDNSCLRPVAAAGW